MSGGFLNGNDVGNIQRQRMWTSDNRKRSAAPPAAARALSMGRYPRFNRGVGMRRDDKMDLPIGVSKEGYAGRLDVIAGPTGRQQR